MLTISRNVVDPARDSRGLPPLMAYFVTYACRLFLRRCLYKCRIAAGVAEGADDSVAVGSSPGLTARSESPGVRGLKFKSSAEAPFSVTDTPNTATDLLSQTLLILISA